MAPMIDVIVCGAGLSGLITTWGLARAGLKVALVDDRGPPGSDPLAEAALFSSWWPVPEHGLYQFAARGIDLIEAAWAESAGGFGVSCCGELIVATRPDQLDLLRNGASRASAFGAGMVREHETADLFLPGHPSGFRGAPGGFDWFATPRALGAAFPMIGPRVQGGLHVRRAGRVEGGELRRWLTRWLRADGVELIDATVVGLEAGADHRWTVRVASGDRHHGSAVVIASGSRLRGWMPAGAGIPLVDHFRLTARLDRGPTSQSAGPIPDLVFWSDGPSLDTVRLSENARLGWQLWWTVEAAAATVGTDPGRALAERFRAIVPDLKTAFAPDFSVSTSRLSLAADRRPLVGPIEPGLFVSVGHGDSLAFAFAATEVLAAQVLDRPLPGYAGSVAADRLSTTLPRLRPASDSPEL